MEIKNVIMGMKQYDPVNRDLEIRDLYNLEDAFHLSKEYGGAYRARLNANLAFYDRLDGKIDWPLGPDGAHPLTELLLADYLVVDVSRPFAADSYFEIEQATLAGRPYETCGGRSLNDDVMDTLLHADDQRRQRPAHPRRRRPADQAGRGRLPLPGGAQSRAVSGRRERVDTGSGDIMTAEATMTTTAPATETLELDDIQAGALMPRPTPYTGTYQILRIDDRRAGRELLRRLIPYLDSVASPASAGGPRVSRSSCSA